MEPLQNQHTLPLLIITPVMTALKAPSYSDVLPELLMTKDSKQAENVLILYLFWTRHWFSKKHFLILREAKALNKIHPSDMPQVGNQTRTTTCKECFLIGNNWLAAYQEISIYFVLQAWQHPIYDSTIVDKSLFSGIASELGISASTRKKQ